MHSFTAWLQASLARALNGRRPLKTKHRQGCNRSVPQSHKSLIRALQASRLAMMVHERLNWETGTLGWDDISTEIIALGW